MAKILVVHYSRTNVTGDAATVVSGHLIGCTRETIEPLKNYAGLRGFLRALMDAILKRSPPIKKSINDPSQFDVVVIGTPVWGGTMATPVKTYLAQHTFKTVAFFSTQGGESFLGNEFVQMAAASIPAIATCAVSTKEVKDGRYVHKIISFVTAIQTSLKDHLEPDVCRHD